MADEQDHTGTVNEKLLPLPDRLRLYSKFHDLITVTVDRRTALLMADDLEAGIRLRLGTKT